MNKYHDSGLPIETEVYGFLDAVDATWSTFEVEALAGFIRERIAKEVAETKAKHDYTGDPKHCHDCAIRAFVNADLRTRAAQTQLTEAIRLAKEATNGWACYAKRKIEHDDIARLHREIRAIESKP